MKAYILKYKGQIPQNWQIEDNDMHECESNDCCNMGSSPVDAGLPIYLTEREILYVIMFQDWQFSIGKGKKTEYIHKSFKSPLYLKVMQALNLDEADQWKTLKKAGFTVKKVNITYY